MRFGGICQGLLFSRRRERRGVAVVQLSGLLVLEAFLQYLSLFRDLKMIQDELHLHEREGFPEALDL